MSSALDDTYLDTGAPAPTPAPLRRADAVPADGAPTSLLFVPFRGPRLSVQYVIAAGDRVYRLKGVFGVKLEYLPDGTVFASHSRLQLHGFGASLSEALSEFAGTFDAQWRSLVEAAPENLTRHAKKVRAELEACVEGIESAAPAR